MNPEAATSTEMTYSTTSIADLKKQKILPQGEVFLVSIRVHNALKVPNLSSPFIIF